MQQPLPQEIAGQHRSFLPAAVGRLVFTLLLFLGAAGAWAQTTIFTETFEGTNSFTYSNSGNNRWTTGTAAGIGPSTATGTKAAYISPDNTAYSYNTANVSVSHMYRNVTFPAGESVITLKLDWKGLGESDFVTYDNLQLFLIPTTVTPSNSNSGGSTSNGRLQNNGAPGPFTPFATLTGQAAYTTSTIALPASAAGTTQRLVFQWYNDGTLGSQPPAAVDNVVLTSAVPVPVCGPKTVGPTGTYASLTAALADVNLNGLCGPLVLELQSTYASTVETFPLVYSNTAGASSTNTVTIRPIAGATGRSITGLAASTSVFNINGGKYLILDGRPGGTGTTADLTVSGLNTSGPTLLFTGDASNNTVQYCQVKGVATSTTSGVVAFAAGTTTGNSSNTIANNKISDGATTPTNLIYSIGLSSSVTNTNTVSNNELFNFFSAGSVTSAITLSATGNTGWSITGNSIYQTATRTYTTGNIHNGIAVGGGTGYTITGNSIGGTAAGATGTAYTLAGTIANRFVGIQGAFGTTGTNLIQGNVIRRFSLATSSGASGAPGVWAGIYVSAGNATIGGAGAGEGNTIGEATGANYITTTSTTTGGITFGINATSATTVSITGNTIAGMRASATGASIAAQVTGIQTNGAGAFTITGNTVGSTTAANGLQSTNTATTTAQRVKGIEVLSTASNTIKGNTVMNLVNATTAANNSHQTIGIVTSAGVNTIGGTAAGEGNTVYNLSNAGINTSGGNSASVIGINQATATAGIQSVVGNTVYALGNAAATSIVVGIVTAGATTTSSLVTRNLVHSLTGSAAGANTLYGIYQLSGIYTIANNMVRLGYDASGTNLSNGNLTLGGIFKVATANTAGTSFLHNSVYIGGTGGATVATFALGRSADNADVLVNNALVNVRSGAAQHVPVQLNSTTGLTVSNNVYYTTNTLASGSAAVATVNGTATATIPGDLSSQNADPKFTAPTTGTPDLHIQPTPVATPVEAAGSSSFTTTDDFDGQTRSGLSPVDIGADAGNFTPSPQVLSNIIYTRNGTVTYGGQNDQQVTGLTLATAGGGTAMVLNDVTFNLTGTATALDINNAKLYSSPTSTFAVGTATLLATTAVVTAPGTITLTPASAPSLAAGSNYYFLTFDIPAVGTTNGRTIAAVPTTVTVSSVAYTSATMPAITLSGSNTNVRTIVSPMSGLYTVGLPTLAVPVPDYATITAAIADVTLRGVSGAVTFSLINDAATPYNGANGETFPLNITAVTGASATNTITFKPALLTTPVITNATASASMFKLTDAAYFIIDGSNTVPSGTDRSLTLNNTAGTGTNAALVWIATSGGTASHDNKVLNTVMQGSLNTAASLTAGVMVSSTTYNSVGANNDNITISNNTMQGVYSGMVCGGTALVSAGGLDGLTITNNIVGPATASVSNNLGLYGIFVQGAVSPTVTGNTVQNVVSTAAGVYGINMSNAVVGITGATVSNNTIQNISGAGTSYGLNSTASAATISGNTISSVSTSSGSPYGMNLTGATNSVTGNTISGISTTGTANAYGMNLGTGFAGTATTGAVVDRNKMYTITSAGSLGYPSYGINVTTGASTNAYLRISNNFIADLHGTSYTSISFAIVGIMLTGTQSGISVYHNSVNLSGTFTPGTTTTGLLTAALAVVSGTTGLDIRNNIFSNTLASTTGTNTSYAFYSSAPKTAFTTIDYNDYYVGTATGSPQGMLAYFNSGNRATVIALQDATNGTGMDANSVSGNPNFTSATDLHIAAGASKAESNGVLIAAAGNDIDNAARGPYPLAGQLNGGGTAPDLGADEGDFTPAPLNDVGITALTAPGTAQTCYTAAETVTVTLKNFSPTSLNFVTNPVTVSGSVAGPNNTTLVPVIINTGTLAAGATQSVTFVSTADMSAAGTYTFNISASVSGGDSDATNDALPSTPVGTNTRTVQAVASGVASASPASLCGTSSTTTLTLTGNTGGTVQWESSTDNLTFLPISGATSNPYTTAALTQTTYFRGVVSCGLASQTSNTVTVTVSDPQITFSSGATRCGAGTVTLQATASAGNTPYYFTTLTGGSPFGSGPSATATVTATPATQTFYVEARNGTLNVTGEQSKTSAPAGSSFTSNSTADRALGFNVTTAGTLSTVDVYPNAAGTLTIRLYTATNPGVGTAVPGSDRTITVTAGQVGNLVTIPLNYALAAGGYKLASSTGGMGRYSTYTGTYPITNGTISVVGSYNTSAAAAYTINTYNSFFNLAFVAGSTGTGCASAPRTAINVTVTTPTALTYTGTTTYCNGSSTTLTFSPSTYTILTVSPTTGTVVDNNAHTITFSNSASATYTVTGADANGNGNGNGSGCSASTTVALTVNPTPNAPTLTPAAAAICAGNSTVVAASTNTNSLTNQTALATADFDSGMNGFTVTNSGLASTAFVYATAPYSATGIGAPSSYNGPSGASTGKFFVASSATGGTGSTTNTQLTSPVFSTVGYTAATLNFQQYYDFFTSTADVAALVEYNAGAGWVTLIDYRAALADNGTSSGAQPVRSLTLPAGALGQAAVQVRFNYQANYANYWAIDNVGVTGTKTEAATFAVTGGTGASVSGSNITFNPTTTTTYNVVATFPSSSGCPSVATPITITVNTATTWTGATSSDWFDATNWTNCVPTILTDATIPDGLTNYPVLTTTATASAKDLNIGTTGVGALASLTISAAAMFDLRGNLNTAGLTSLVATAGTMAFNGTIPQNIGAGQFYNMLLGGSTTKMLVASVEVAHNVDLTDGLLYASGFELRMTGTTGIFTGASATHFVIAPTGGGSVRVDNVGTGAGTRASAFFPIGTSASYTPATLTNTGTTDSFTASVADGITSGPAPAGHVVNKTWDISEGTVGGSNATLTLQWNTSDEQSGFNRALSAIAHFENGAWNAKCYTCFGAAAGNNPWTLSRTGITSFSPFAVEDGTKPLPVELTRFAATREGLNASLTWATVSEKNNAGFEVQVSTTGAAFRKLAFVEAKGAKSGSPTAYTYLDVEQGKAGLRYYRLRQLDLDGTESFSPVRTVQFGEALSAVMLTAAPNPFQQQLTLTVEVPAEVKAATLTLTDAAGRILRKQQVPTLAAGRTALEVPNAGELSSGVYFIQLTLPGQPVQHVKVVKQ